MQPHSPDIFFQQIRNSFLAAREAAQTSLDYDFHIGEYSIRLNFNCGDMYSKITPAFDHIRIPANDKPHLTIHCWESFSTQTPPPYLPWSDKHFISPKEIPYFSERGVHISFNKQHGSLSALSESDQAGLFWINSLPELPFYEQSTPLRFILHWFMKKWKHYCTHSAAVSNGDSGVLLSGQGRAGKSTTSLLCLLKGMKFAGDDYVMLSENSTFSIQSLYCSAKVDPASLDVMPELRERMINRDSLAGEKAVFFLNDLFPGQIVSGFPISAILLPKITGGSQTAVKAASASEGIKALAPSTVFLQAGAKQETFAFLTRLVKHVPCFTLELGRDFESIPKAIHTFMKDL